MDEQSYRSTFQVLQFRSTYITSESPEWRRKGGPGPVYWPYVVSSNSWRHATCKCLSFYIQVSTESPAWPKRISTACGALGFLGPLPTRTRTRKVPFSNGHLSQQKLNLLNRDDPYSLYAFDSLHVSIFIRITV